MLTDGGGVEDVVCEGDAGGAGLVVVLEGLVEAAPLTGDQVVGHHLGQVGGLIVFTDADGAGFVIRNHLKSAIPNKFLKHAYIPDIPGKEKRKSAPGKEGKLGVEGMTPDIILQALRNAGATIEGETEKRTAGAITKADLMELGLAGIPGSEEKRKKLMKRLDLPEHMSPNALLQALNLLYDLEGLEAVLSTLE